MEKTYYIISVGNIRTLVIQNAGLLGEDLFVIMGYAFSMENHDDASHFSFSLESNSDVYNWGEVMKILTENDYEQITQ